jgi:hypothetical protein
MFHPDNTAISNNKIAYTYVYLIPSKCYYYNRNDFFLGGVKYFYVVLASLCDWHMYAKVMFAVST